MGKIVIALILFITGVFLTLFVYSIVTKEDAIEGETILSAKSFDKNSEFKLMTIKNENIENKRIDEYGRISFQLNADYVDTFISEIKSHKNYYKSFKNKSGFEKHLYIYNKDVYEIYTMKDNKFRLSVAKAVVFSSDEKEFLFPFVTWSVFSINNNSLHIEEKNEIQYDSFEGYQSYDDYKEFYLNFDENLYMFDDENKVIKIRCIEIYSPYGVTEYGELSSNYPITITFGQSEAIVSLIDFEY